LAVPEGGRSGRPPKAGMWRSGAPESRKPSAAAHGCATSMAAAAAAKPYRINLIPLSRRCEGAANWQPDVRAVQPGYFYLLETKATRAGQWLAKTLGPILRSRRTSAMDAKPNVVKLR